MPIIAVINRKGGSGKSTLATHLAVWLARQGVAVMLGDVDRQQSTRTWLRRRNPALPAIMAWAIDQKNVLKVPNGATHVVLDTPGGFHGLELAKVIMSADAVIIPVCSSVFDRESAAACYAELAALPRVASGRCKLGVVGMRIDARTHAAQTLGDWAGQLDIPFLGVLRETQLYVKTLETGQALFDLPAATIKADLLQWEPILEWLRPITWIKPASPESPLRLSPTTTEIEVKAVEVSFFNTPTPIHESSSPRATKNEALSTTTPLQNTTDDELVLVQAVDTPVPRFLLRQR